MIKFIKFHMSCLLVFTDRQYALFILIKATHVNYWPHLRPPPPLVLQGKYALHANRSNLLRIKTRSFSSFSNHVSSGILHSLSTAVILWFLTKKTMIPNPCAGRRYINAPTASNIYNSDTLLLYHGITVSSRTYRKFPGVLTGPHFSV